MKLLSKVLVIDDKFDSVSELIKNLTSCGVPILFWDGQGELPKSVLNVRVLILDLNLIGGDFYNEMYDDVADRIKDISGPYAVLIVSNYNNIEAPDHLLQAYLDVTGKELPGIVIRPGFTKEQALDVEKVIDSLESTLQKYDVLRIILLTELVLDDGRHNILKKLGTKQFNNTVRSLIDCINRESGKESAAREFALLMARFITRNMSASEHYKELTAAIESISPPTSNEPDEWSYVGNLRAYLEPEASEGFWTGDIFSIGIDGKIPIYAILITPKCDISVGKADLLTFCKGYKVPGEDCIDNDYPLLKCEKKLKINDLKDRIRDQRWPIRYYPLHCFIDEEHSKKAIQIIFDFQQIESITEDNLRSREWSRICRLDSPYIEDLLQKHSSYCSRLGTPAQTPS